MNLVDLWYSEKQKTHVSLMNAETNKVISNLAVKFPDWISSPRPSSAHAELENGSIVEFTESCTIGAKPIYAWDDSFYLGRGVPMV